MKIAVIGSRSITNVDIGKYIPSDITQLITGGARGVDTLAEKYADGHKILKLIIKPDYGKIGKFAALIRNRQIVDSADIAIAIWDGFSRGTKYTVDYAKRISKPVLVYIIKNNL